VTVVVQLFIMKGGALEGTELVSGERESDAEAALEALAIHRYDPRLCAELELRTAHDDDLARRFRALF
jgi:hypothetical protein